MGFRDGVILAAIVLIAAGLSARARTGPAPSAASDIGTAFMLLGASVLGAAAETASRLPLFFSGVCAAGSALRFRAAFDRRGRP